MSTQPHIDLIQSNLEIILTQGGIANFVIFHLDGENGYYIQVAGESDGRRLWVEACNSKKVGDRQRQKLKELGWKPPKKGNLVNYYKQYYPIDISVCGEVATWIYQTMKEVYGFQDGHNIRPHLNLE